METKSESVDKTFLKEEFYFSSPEDPFPKGITEKNFIEWLRQYLENDANLLVIGSKMGEEILLLQESFNKGYIFLYDPLVHKRIVTNMDLNNVKNVVTHNVILGSFDREMYFSLSNNSFSEEKKSKDDIKVIMNSLDSFNISEIGLILISEVQEATTFFMGMSKTLRNSDYPPIVIKEKILDQKIFERLGYKYIAKISGTTDYFLVSDNPKRKKWEEEKRTLKNTEYSEILDSLEENEEINFENRRKYWNLSKFIRNSSNKVDYSTDKICNFFEKLLKSLEKETSKEKMEDLLNFLVGRTEPTVKYLVGKFILNKSLSSNFRNNLLEKHTPGIIQLPILSKKVISIDLPEGYLPSSPSLLLLPEAEGGSKYYCNVRAVNYSIDQNGGYIIRDPQQTVRTKNFICKLDENLKVLEVKELIDNSNNHNHLSRIVGLEDIRLFTKEDIFCISVQNAMGIPLVNWCKYSFEKGVHWSTIPTISPGRIEKNWAPFIHQDKVHFVYSWDPIRIFSLNQEGGGLVKEGSFSKNNQTLEDFRGSSNLIPYKLKEREGYLAIIHQVRQGSPRKYFHRFIWLSYDFNIFEFTNLFYFNEPNIEFSVSVTSVTEGVYVCHSFRDNSAEISLVDHQILEEMFIVD